MRTTTVHLLHAGYVRAGGRVGGSVTLVRDGDAVIVADPGMVAARSALHHPDHTVNIALFPNAEVVDFWARYKDDLWLDHDGDGYALSPRTHVWLTPGHTEEDAPPRNQGDRAD